jgi:hypothetical protein
MGPLELAELSLELGYERDARGLLLQTRDPDPGDVRRPVLHLVRTLEGNRWALSAALTEARRAAVEGALRMEPVIASLVALEANAPRAAGTIAAAVGTADPLEEYRGPAFVFPEALVSPASEVEVEVVDDPRGIATVSPLDWVREATRAAHPLCVARNSRGEVVAVCHSSRSIPRAAAAGVETAEAYRGRGAAVVAGWAAAVRAEGRVPFYGTSWENGPSRGIARRLGLVMFGEDYHVG